MIYLNNAATSYPKPKEVISAVDEYIQSVPYHSQRSGIHSSIKDIETSCRNKLANLFNIDNPNNIFFTSGCTESLNLVINGLKLHGAHIITTNTEHNSVYRPLKHLERDGAIELSIIECDELGHIDPEKCVALIKKNTKMLIINHCSNVTGHVADVKKFAEIAHSHNLYILIDAAQSAGAVHIDVKDFDIDFLAFTGHKNLYGLPGIGGLYARDSIVLAPLKVGGTGIRSDLLYQPEERPLYYEAGTKNIPGIVSIDAGLDFILKTGLAAMHIQKQQLLQKTIEAMKSHPMLTLYGGLAVENREPIISFNIKGLSPEDAGYILENSFNIIVRSGLHCAPLIHEYLGSYPAGSIRISYSYFTLESEIDYLIDSVNRICEAI